MRVLQLLPNFNLKVKWQQIAKTTASALIDFFEPCDFQCCRGACLTSALLLFWKRLAASAAFVTVFRRRDCTVPQIFASKNVGHAQCAFCRSAADSFSNLHFKGIFITVCWQSDLWCSDLSDQAKASNSWYNPIKVIQKIWAKVS